MENINTNNTDLEKQLESKLIKTVPKVRRSSFSPRNALRFKKIFDIAIRDKKDLLIPVQGSIPSFHTKCSDALKYLYIYNDDPHTDTLGLPHEKGAYLKLRSEIKFKSVQDPRDNKWKIRLAFNKNELLQEIESSEYYQEHLVPPSEEERLAEKIEDIQKGNDPDWWKTKLINDFASNSEALVPGKPFKITGLNLDMSEIEWAIKILSQISNCIYDVDTNIITAQIVDKSKLEG